jgi:hypothetical protein
MKRSFLLCAILGFTGLAGCCYTVDFREAVILSELDEGVSCEELCAPRQGSELELLECEFGETESREPAAICTYAYVECPDQM